MPSVFAGFAARALAETPPIPGWIWFLARQGGRELAGFHYRLHYPLDSAGAADWLVAERAIFAETAARGAARAHHARTAGIIAAESPALPDDEAFRGLRAGQEWDGHWYSRDTAEDWGLDLDPTARHPDPARLTDHRSATAISGPRAPPGREGGARTPALRGDFARTCARGVCPAPYAGFSTV